MSRHSFPMFLPIQKTILPEGIDLIGEPQSRSKIPTPALILDLDALEKNIKEMASLTRKIRLRPHAKCHKSIQIAKRQIEAGAVGISCATLAEAETMVRGGIPGVLITTPIVSPEKIDRLIQLNNIADDFAIVVDSIQNIDDLARTEKPLQLFIDFDIGQGRTGAKSISEALALRDRIGAHPSLKLVGIQAYGGHFQHIASYEERGEAIQTQNKRIIQLASHLPYPPIITGGGTGTHDIDLKQGVYTEIQPGSYLFMDVEYLAVALLKDLPSPFLSSLFVLSTVTSSNCIIDAGLKAFATDGPTPSPTYEFKGDEHGKLSSPLPIGSTLELPVPHCDPTVNLYDFYHCVRGDTLVDIWPVDARGYAKSKKRV